MNRSRILQSIVAMTANATLPNRNVVAEGIPDTYRLDSLVFDFEVDADIALATSLRLDPASLMDLLDACISSVRLSSTALGEVVARMSLSQLYRAALPLGAHVRGLEHVFAGDKIAAISHPLRFSVEIPWVIPLADIRGRYAPQAYQFPDGGLEQTIGTMAFTDADGSAFTLGAASRMRVLWVGRDMGVKLKTSSILYERIIQSVTSWKPKGGRYLHLAQITDDVATLMALAAPVDTSLEARQDGEPIYTGNEYDPQAAFIQAITAGRGNDLDTALAVQDGGAFSAGGSLDPLFALPYLPIFFPDDYEQAADLFPEGETFSLVFGTGYATTYTVVSARVRPIDAVGDVAGCNCSSEPVTPAVNGAASTSLADSKVTKYGARLIG